MTSIYADIRLSYGDKEMQLSIAVNRSAQSLALNETWQEALQLPVVSQTMITFPNGDVQMCDVAGPVSLRWLDRQIHCTVLILPGDTAPYLGSGPLLELGAAVDMQGKQLVRGSKDDGKIYL